MSRRRTGGARAVCRAWRGAGSKRRVLRCRVRCGHGRAGAAAAALALAASPFWLPSEEAASRAALAPLTAGARVQVPGRLSCDRAA